MCSQEMLTTNLQRLPRMRRDVRRIFRAAVYAVDPKVLIRKNVKCLNNSLHFRIGDSSTPIYQPNHNLYVCGFGKAVAPMAAQLQETFEPHINRGVISVPFGFKELSQSLKKPWLPHYPIEVMEGAANNIPDNESLQASQRIVDMIGELNETDILFVLISGGGSALAPLPKPPLTLDDKRNIISTLSKRGASIQELNKVRIRLSRLKGGQLLQHTKAQVISLILSDIIDSPLDLIASGPTVPSSVSADEVIRILRKFDFEVNEELGEIIRRDSTSTALAQCVNHTIGSNMIALEAASEAARSLYYHTIIATDKLVGEAREVGAKIADIAKGNHSSLGKEIEEKLRDLPKDQEICLLFGGETTVNVKGNGKGGRNQEMALAAAIALEHHDTDTAFLSAGTDGQDGPTDAAGAAVDQETVAEFMTNYNIRPEEFLENNDSYNYFNNDYYALIKTGHTGTNVMDVQVLLFVNK